MPKQATIAKAWAQKYPEQGGGNHEQCGKTRQPDGGRLGENNNTKCSPTSPPGTKVNVPILADAVANFECRLVEITCPGNFPLIVGAVLASHVNADPALPRLMNLGKNYQQGTLRDRKVE